MCPVIEDLGFNSYHTKELPSIDIQIPNTASVFPDWSFDNEKISNLKVDKLLAGSITSQAITLAVLAGEGDVYIASGKTDFTNTDAGFILGVDDSDSDTAKLYIGDSSNYLNWTGSALNIVGTITATSGAIGGWTINATSITDTAGVVGLSSAVTGGDDIRFWAGDATPASAEFKVTEAGALTATSATITGDITATTGYFQTVTLGKTGVASGTMTLQLNATGGDTYIGTGKTDFTNTDPGFIIGIDDSDSDLPKFYIGTSTAYFNFTGSAVNIRGVTIDYPTLTNLVAGSEIAIQGWQFDGAFSATDYRIVAWGSGTLTLLDGTTYSIDAGNTGNIAALTYVYLAIGTSETVLQTSTTAADAVGTGKILTAVAQNNTDTSSQATFQVFGGKGGQLVAVGNIAANSASTNEFVSNTAQIKNLIVTSAKINDLTVDKLLAGTIASQAIVLGITADAGDCYIAAGKTDFDNTQTGFILGLDDSDSDTPKFYIGDTTNYLNWTGTGLDIAGTLTVSTVPNLPGDENLSAYYSFNEGSGGTAYDNSAGAHHGTLTDMTSADWVTGIAGTGLDFDGSNDWVSIDNFDPTGGSGATISVCCWVKGATQDNKVFVAHQDGGTSQASWAMSSIDASNSKLKIVLSDDGSLDAGHIKNYKSSITIGDSAWHLVAFTWNAGTLKLYIDGAEDTSVTKTTDAAITALHASTAALSLGAVLVSGVDQANYAGIVDEVRIYNDVLTANEIKALYANPSGVTTPELTTEFNLYDAIGTNDGAGGGELFHVKGTNTTYTTLAATIAAGATKIFLRSGTYTLASNLSISAADTQIVGENWNETIIAGNYQLTVTGARFQLKNIKKSGCATDAYMIDLSSAVTDAVIQNCRFDFTDASCGVIDCEGANTKILDNYVNVAYTDNNTQADPATYFVIYAAGANTIISGNEMTGSTNLAIRATLGDDCIIENNIFNSTITTTDYWLLESFSSDRTIIRNNFFNNGSTNNNVYGIRLGSQKNIVSGNNFLYTQIIIYRDSGTASLNRIIDNNFNSGTADYIIFGTTNSSATQVLNNNISGGDYGMSLAAGSGNMMSGNYIINTGTAAIRSTTASTVIANNNISATSATYGIYADADYHEITGNRIFSTDYNIYLGTSADYCTVTGNVSEDADTDGIHVLGTGNVVSGNNSYNGGGHGVYVDNSNNILTGNYCDSNGGDGIEVNGAAKDELIVSNNICRGNTGWGILFDNDPTSTVCVGNMLKGNTAGQLSGAAGANSQFANNVVA